MAERASLAELALGDGTPKRAFVTALVVGTVLTVINHGDLLIAGIAPDWLKVALTYVVPYCVTTWGAVTGKLARERREEPAREAVRRQSG